MKEGNIKKSCVGETLKWISLGKYQTIFYSDKTGSSYTSSVFGGLSTIFLLLLIGTGILSQLVSVFSKSHYNLDQNAEGLAAYQADAFFQIHQSDISCENCRRISLSDYLESIVGFSLDVTTQDPLLDCSTIVFNAYLAGFDVDLGILSDFIHLDSFPATKQSPSVCTFNFIRLLQYEFGQSTLNELALLQFHHDDQMRSRFLFYLSGIPIGGIVQRNFRDSHISPFGLTTMMSISRPATNGSIIIDDFQLSYFIENQSLLPYFYNQIQARNMVVQKINTNIFRDPSFLLASDQIYYQMGYQTKIDIYERYPDTLAMAMTKVGSLIALIKVAGFLRLYHQRKFEKFYSSEMETNEELALENENVVSQNHHFQINSHSQEDLLIMNNEEPVKVQQFRDTFTFENIKDLMDTVHELKIRLMDQESRERERQKDERTRS